MLPRRTAGRMSAKRHIPKVHCMGALRWDQKLQVPLHKERWAAVGLSGGVDSAVAAYLLQEAGWNVLGVHCVSWDEKDETGFCAGQAELRDAERVAQQLGIDLQIVELVPRYWHTVFEPFLDGLAAGHTPNPDLACNTHVKFAANGSLKAKALQLLAAYVRDKPPHVLEPKPAFATGHYARLVGSFPAATGINAEQREVKGQPPSDSGLIGGLNQGQFLCGLQHPGATGAALARAADLSKDQSYFLAAEADGGSCWEQILFPLGGWTKAEVRAKAAEIGGPLGALASKPSSVGLCFVGKRRRFGDFLAGYLPPPSKQSTGSAQAPILPVAEMLRRDSRDFDDVRQVEMLALGAHSGLWRYTLGQGAGLGGQTPNPAVLAAAGGAKAKDSRWFVVGKDVPNGALLVGRGRCHPALFSASVVGSLQLSRTVVMHGADRLNTLLSPGVGKSTRTAAPATQWLRCRYKVRYSQAEPGWCDLEPLWGPEIDIAASTFNFDVASAGKTAQWPLDATEQACTVALFRGGENVSEVPVSRATRGEAMEGAPRILVRLHFHRPQRAVTPGQPAVLYGPLQFVPRPPHSALAKVGESIEGEPLPGANATARFNGPPEVWPCPPSPPHPEDGDEQSTEWNVVLGLVHIDSIGSHRARGDSDDVKFTGETLWPDVPFWRKAVARTVAETQDDGAAVMCAAASEIAASELLRRAATAVSM